MNENVLNKVDEIMLKQLDLLDKISIKDKDFSNIIGKAKTIVLISDKLIQSQIAQLKSDIWNKSQLYRERNKGIPKGASYIDVENNFSLDYEDK